MSAAPAAVAGGLGDAVRAIGVTLAELACVRASLASIELAEEIERRKRQLVLGVLATLLLYTAFLLATFFVAAIFWDTHRLAALAVLALVHLACGASALALLASRARTAPAPFAATREEFARDVAAWRASR
jgi:uncharacterized membrane protein YqjE